MRLASLSILLLLFGGCVSSASQIMQSYVGQDVRIVMVDYGPPNNAFDMPGGQRAFQWVMGRSYTTPAHAQTTGTVNVQGPTAWVNTNTTITGGQTINSKCLYTLFANWNEQTKGWIVNSYRKPSLRCEY